MPKKGKPKPVKPNNSARADYRSELIKKVVDPLYDKSTKIVNSNASDSEKRLEAMNLLNVRPEAAGLASVFVTRIDNENTKKVKGQLKKYIPVDSIGKSPDSVLIKKTLDNVDLIVTLNQRAKLDFSKLIVDSIEKGVDQKAVIDQLKGKYKSSKFNATRIASDQSKKLNGVFTAEKHKQAGISKFTWTTVEDESVREEHAELDGKVFSYNDPPSIGLPGEAGINCRCLAIPII